MKQYILYSLFILAGLVAACDNERSGLVETGTVVLGIDKNETLYTKAGTPVTNEKLQVYFINLDGDTTKFYNDYKQEVEGKKILLPVGSYTVKVTSVATKEPAWETPSYYGEEDIEVTAGEIVQAAIECKISNTKVYVKYTESVKKYFSNYQATVSNTGGKLTYLKDETRAGFFAPEKLTVDLKLTNKENGLTFDLRKVFPDINPRYQYKLLFDVATPGEPGDSSGENVDIEINTDSLQVQITIKLPQYVENGDKKPMPKFAIATLFADDSKPDGYETIFTRTQDESGNYQDAVKEQTATIESSLGLKYLYVKLSETFTGMSPMFDLLKKEIDPITFTADKQKKKIEIHLAKLINAKMLPDGKKPQTYTITMTAIDLQHQETEQIFTYIAKPDLPLSTLELTAADKWTTFAVLRGAGADATDTYFEYKAKNEVEWNTVPAIKDKEGNLNALVVGLKENTEYLYKVIGQLNGENKEGEVYTFNTLEKATVPNLNFDDWYSGTPNNAWYLGVDSQKRFWDSGNGGANTVKEINPTSKETENKVKDVLKNSAAAKLESKKVNAVIFNVFAAGNIYTGSFIDPVIGGSAATSGALLDFGIPYDGRPTKLKGYYQYSPKNVNWGAHGEIKNGDQDKCTIYVALCDWTTPFRVNTKESLFVDTNANYVLGYGELSDENASKSMSAYESFEIDIKYRKNINKKVTYILIVASASKYGDYFTGGEGSTLYIDEFSLDFDYNPASFIGTPLEGLTPANK